MPYTTENAPVKDVLPKAALKLWVSTFNSVLEETKDEDQARKAAWSNVKKAGYRQGEDDKWVKSESSDVVLVDGGDIRVLESTEAMALPKATLSKVYAEFKYASFDVGNANRDGFLASDVTEEHLKTLVGSPIYLQEDASDHPLKKARASKRAPFYAGSIVSFERRADGIYCVGAFQRETLEDRGIKPERLDKDYSVSMEVTFDKTKSKYKVGDRILTYEEALEEGVASPLGKPDDSSNYDVRFNVPLDFHGTALLIRGRNADKTADILRVAASEETIIWAEPDYALHVAGGGSKPQTGDGIHSTGDDMAQSEGATLSTEERNRLPKSSFAYVDDEGEGHLPIHDAEHVKASLARLNQTEISEAAKRKALRKIMRAVKKYGVEVDKDSEVVKRYAIAESYEAKLQEIREAFYDEFGYSDGEAPQYLQYTYEDYVIFQRGDKIFRANFKRSGDEIEFGKETEVEVVFRPVKSEGAEMAETQKQPEIQMSKAEFDAAVDAKAQELVKAREADIAVERLDQRRKEIAQAAVEEYKATEKMVSDRMAELNSIMPVVQAEKAELEAKIREADEAEYTKIKADRAIAALEAVRKDAVAAAINEDTVPAPALRGSRPAGGPSAYADPFRVTVAKQ